MIQFSRIHSLCLLGNDHFVHKLPVAEALLMGDSTEEGDVGGIEILSFYKFKIMLTFIRNMIIYIMLTFQYSQAFVNKAALEGYSIKICGQTPTQRKSIDVK